MRRLIRVGPAEPITRADLAEMPPVHVPEIEKLRDSHRRLARLIAAGLKNGEVAAITGMSEARISTLKRSPAFIELIESLRASIDAGFIKSQDHYYGLATTNMVRAEQILADRLEAAAEDPDGPQISTKDLLAITRDAADRFGYGKKKLEIRANFSFADKMEAAQRRSRPRELEHEA